MVKVDCLKCSGTGNIQVFSHVAGGVCFACEGAGFKTYKTKPVAKRTFAVSFQYGTVNAPTAFVHCWNINSRNKKSVERKAAAAIATNGAIAWKVEEIDFNKGAA